MEVTPISGNHFLTHPYIKMMAFIFVSSWCLSPKGVLPEAEAEAIMHRKESPLQCRRCPLTNEEGTTKSGNNPSYLPGYSWIQIAFELLNVRMGRILHLESFLQEAQKQKA